MMNTILLAVVTPQSIYHFLSEVSPVFFFPSTVLAPEKPPSELDNIMSFCSSLTKILSKCFCLFTRVPLILTNTESFTLGQCITSRLNFPDEFCIFRYFYVLPSGTTFPYATRKRKRNEKEGQRNVVSTSATSVLHTYFLCCRSTMQFTLLLKRHQRAAATMGGIYRFHGYDGCSICRRRPPNLMVAAAAEVAANVSGVLSAPNLDPALLFLALVLLASRNGY